MRAAWSRLGAIARAEEGATAVEMAFLAPAFLMLLIGTIQGSLIVYTKASLHYAVQKHVRCVAISKAGTCPDAKTHYFAPGPTPAFTQTSPTGTQTCLGVTGTVNYDFNIGFLQRTIPLSATTCFPPIYRTPPAS
jgi:Flp pilus assembly protein TadG